MATYLKLTLTLLIVSSGCKAPGTSYSAARAAPAVTSPKMASVTTSETASARTDEPDTEIQQVSVEEPVPIDGASSNLPATIPLPATNLSLGNSIALGLSQNPDLVALRQTEHVGAAALGVAQTYPFNPFVQVQATPYQDAVSSGPGTTYHYVLLMQTIQLAHQQQFREDGAACNLNSTRWNIHQAELLNVGQTERLYFTTLYLQGLLELAQASHENNRQLLRTLEKQLEAGQATAADVAIVRVDTRSTHQQQRLARANHETALRDLKRQLGLPADDPAVAVGDLRLTNWRDPVGIVLKSQSVESAAALKIDHEQEQEKYLISSRAAARPDVMAAHSDIDTARANLGLASASRVPDLQIGPYYQRTADGTTFLGFRAQMDLPVINSGRPLEQQRTAELNQRIAVWQQAMRRAELEAQAAWERYKLAHEAVTEDSADVANDLPKTLQGLEQQFNAGEVDVVRVVQARTSIIQNQRVRLDLLNELAQAAANLTATTGMSVDELLQ
jgi:cobalt-zinc-cadmium efflux system outer membrane protein